MKANTAVEPGRMLSSGWVIIVRLILYMVVVGFFLQYIYFGEKGQFYRPGATVAELAAAFLFNLAIMLLGRHSRRLSQLVALTYVVDLMALTHVILASGGFNSVLIPYYLPILVMAAAVLPRRLTAAFPSMATLGVAYIGLAHLQVTMGKIEPIAGMYPDEVLNSLRYSHPHTIVSTMLILSVVFFVVSYLSGILSDRLFTAQRLNAEVLSSMKEGVAVVDPRGILLYVNSEFTRIFPEAWLGGDFSGTAKLLFGTSGEGFSFADILQHDLSETMTVVREARPGETRPPVEIRISGIRMRGRNGPYTLVFLVSDLTLRRRVEKAERSLERFSAISTMAAGLAHEIRNPLASLRSAIQEIGGTFPDDSQNRVLTDVVIAESDRLDGIIGRFLDFSREGRLRLGKCRLGPLLEEVRTMVSRDRETEFGLRVNGDPEVVCDSDRMVEVFLNLALNAAQAAPEKGGRVDMILGQAERDGALGVEVLFLDNGPGINEGDLPHLFEPFFSCKSGGTGMGLPLARKQVGMHGGDIDAANRPEGGACFRMWIPLEPPATDPGRGATRVLHSRRLASVRR